MTDTFTMPEPEEVQKKAKTFWQKHKVEILTATTILLYVKNRRLVLENSVLQAQITDLKDIANTAFDSAVYYGSQSPNLMDQYFGPAQKTSKKG